MTDKHFIRNITEADLDYIIEISNTCFGREYLKKPELQEFILSENNIGILSLNNKTITGFALAQICNLKELLSITVSDKEWFSKNFEKIKNLGVLKMIAVDPLYANQGIGSALTLRRIELLSRETNNFLAISWEQKQNSGNIKILKKHGFTLDHKIENYWNKDSIQKNYHCANCGNPPCTCSAMIYTRS